MMTDCRPEVPVAVTFDLWPISTPKHSSKYGPRCGTNIIFLCSHRLLYCCLLHVSQSVLCSWSCCWCLFDAAVNFLSLATPDRDSHHETHWTSFWHLAIQFGKIMFNLFIRTAWLDPSWRVFAQVPKCGSPTRSICPGRQYRITPGAGGSLPSYCTHGACPPRILCWHYGRSIRTGCYYDLISLLLLFYLLSACGKGLLLKFNSKGCR